MKEFPTLFKKKDECCGCMVCYVSCSQNAIVIQRDKTGFAYPVIKENNCVKCYKCINLCPIKKHEKI